MPLKSAFKGVAHEREPRGEEPAPPHGTGPGKKAVERGQVGSSLQAAARGALSVSLHLLCRMETQAAANKAGWKFSETVHQAPY